MGRTALSRVGVVEFLGANMSVEATSSGRFRAGSPSSPTVIDADGLIEARLPTLSLSRTRNALLHRLRDAAIILADLVYDMEESGRLRSDRGTPHK